MAIVPRGNKKHGTVYQVRVLDSFNNWYPSKSFVSKKEARAENERLLLQARHGVTAPLKDRRKVTLLGYWKYWRAESRQNASEGWRLTQDQMFLDHIAPKLGSQRLSAINPHHVRSLLNELERQGYSAQTRLHVFNLLHKIFEDALDEEDSLLTSNPARKKLRPKVDGKERCFLPPSDARLLLEAARDDYLGPLIWLGILVGLRSEALLPLRVGRVDLERRQILIAECFKRKVNRIEDTPKGGRQEYVPVPKVLADYLVEKLRDKKAADYVVSGKRAEMVSYNTLLDGLTRLCAKAGVKRITPHEMRHTAPELWIECGATEEDVRRLLNQKSASTIKRYIHRSDERLNALAKRVGASGPIAPMPSAPPTVAEEPTPIPVPRAAGADAAEPTLGAKIIPLRLARK